MEDDQPQEPESGIEALRADLDELRREVYAAETGVFAKVSKWAGLVGLVVSSALALTAIWDWAVTEQANRLADNIARVDSVLVELAKANATIAQVPPQSPQYQAIAQNINGLKIPLVDTAVTTVNEIQQADRSAVSSGALLALAYELGNQQRYADAIEIANRASENATNKAIELESRRLSASVSFQSLDDNLVMSGRTEFKTVISEASMMRGLTRYLISSNAIRDWAVSEGLVGNCDAYRPSRNQVPTGPAAAAPAPGSRRTASSG
jgi:hypothetical protein